MRVVIHDELDLNRSWIPAKCPSQHLFHAFQTIWFSFWFSVLPCRAPWEGLFFITYFGIESSSSRSVLNFLLNLLSVKCCLQVRYAFYDSTKKKIVKTLFFPIFEKVEQLHITQFVGHLSRIFDEWVCRLYFAASWHEVLFDSGIFDFSKFLISERSCFFKNCMCWSWHSEINFVLFFLSFNMGLPNLFDHFRHVYVWTRNVLWFRVHTLVSSYMLGLWFHHVFLDWECRDQTSYVPRLVILKMSRSTPYWNLAALLKMSVFYTTRNFRQFWADPTFTAVRSTFLAKEEAQNVEILPHQKFWPFLGRPFEDVRFYSI